MSSNLLGAARPGLHFHRRWVAPGSPVPSHTYSMVTARSTSIASTLPRKYLTLKRHSKGAGHYVACASNTTPESDQTVASASAERRRASVVAGDRWCPTERAHPTVTEGWGLGIAHGGAVLVDPSSAHIRVVRRERRWDGSRPPPARRLRKRLSRRPARSVPIRHGEIVLTGRVDRRIAD